MEIVIILEAVVGLIAAYLLFYARQKGKNLADKQDLEKITEIVEEIKKNKNKEIELLKANLDFMSSRKLELFAEEKKALINFYAQINTWMWDSLNARLHEYNHTNYLEISDKLIFTRDMYNRTNIAFSNVQLLISDKDLVMVGHEAIAGVLKLHHFVESLFLKLKFNLASEKVAINQLLDKQFDFRRLPKELQDFEIRQSTDRKQEKEEILEAYRSKHSELFNPALKAVYTFQGLATAYLKS